MADKSPLLNREQSSGGDEPGGESPKEDWVIVNESQKQAPTVDPGKSGNEFNISPIPSPTASPVLVPQPGKRADPDPLTLFSGAKPPGGDLLNVTKEPSQQDLNKSDLLTPQSQQPQQPVRNQSASPDPLAEFDPLSKANNQQVQKPSGDGLDAFDMLAKMQHPGPTPQTQTVPPVKREVSLDALALLDEKQNNAVTQPQPQPLPVLKVPVSDGNSQGAAPLPEPTQPLAGAEKRDNAVLPHMSRLESRDALDVLFDGKQTPLPVRQLSTDALDLILGPNAGAPASQLQPQISQSHPILAQPIRIVEGKRGHVVVADPLPTPVQTPDKQAQNPNSLLSNLKLPVKQQNDPDKKGTDAPAPVTNIPLHDSKINPPAKKQQPQPADVVVFHPDPQHPKETKGSDKTPIKITPVVVIKEERCPICNKMISGDEQKRSAHVNECLAKASKQMEEDEKLAKMLAEGKTPPSLMETCGKCKKQFKADQIKEHSKNCGVIKINRPEAPTQQCGVCGKGGYTQAELKKHVPRCVNGLPDMSQCPLCLNEFPQKELEKHVEKCEGQSEDQGQCPLCNKMFPRSGLEAHVNRCVG